MPASRILDRAPEPPVGSGRFGRLRRRLHTLYYGETLSAVRFRTAWLILDVCIIAFFIAAPLLRDRPEFLIIDYAVAALLAVDLSARAIACGNLRAFLSRPSIWLDIFILATLLFPHWLFNLGFLRVLRLWTLTNSEAFWDTVGRRFDDTRVEEVTRAVMSLITFVFVVTGFVYASFAGRGVAGYVDALYFTITTLTTTGYGDVTLPGTWGKLASILIMVIGFSLFLRLAQAVFTRGRKHSTCETCRLETHERDAACCRRCGATLPPAAGAAEALAEP